MDAPLQPPQGTVPDPADNADEQRRQLLLTWLAQPTHRVQRRFLETHTELLTPHSNNVLEEHATQEARQTGGAKLAREALFLLQEAGTRGGTEEAVRDAYINLYGGFALDLPEWLLEVEQKLANLKQSGQPDQTATARMDLLQNALDRAQQHPGIAHEMLATLYHELALALIKNPQQHKQHFEAALDCCVRALSFFTQERYAYQYARVQARMSESYRCRIAGEKRDNVEQAIACLHKALCVFALETYPYDYAEANLYLGSAYWERVAGEKRENLEQALVCFQASLQGITTQSHPHSYAISLSNLALAYSERIAGRRRENLERAIAYRQDALRIFTLEAYPFDHALVLNNLGAIYRDRLAGERQANLEQAIACFREALQVFTLDAYPSYYARTSGNLGVAYRERLVGDRQENLELSIASFSEALRVYTREAYPYEYARIQNNLGAVYQLYPTREKTGDLAQALLCFRQALQVYTQSAFPLEYRRVQLACAETQAQRGDWLAAHEAYVAAQEAEELLVGLGAGAVGRDAVRRARYTAVRQSFIEAQVALHTPPGSELDEDARRRSELERIAAYRFTDLCPFCRHRFACFGQ